MVASQCNVQGRIIVDGKKQRLGPFDLPAGATNGTIVGHSN
ncbi:MAG: hypothetical protein ACJAYX_002466 [Planctomycetota bacterium]|jgi:hypothetical protein